MPRTAQAAALAGDDFLVDPEMREVDGDAVGSGADDHAFDRHVRPLGKANRSAHVASDDRRLGRGEVPQSSLGTIHDFERPTAAEKEGMAG